MPVVECSKVEEKAIDALGFCDQLLTLAVEERSKTLEPGALSYARRVLFGAQKSRKHWTLTRIVSSRVLPTGERASLPKTPEPYWFLRDPDGDALLIVWGDVWEGRPRVDREQRELERAAALGDTDAEEALRGLHHVQLKPYVPLPRYLPPDELELLQRYTAHLTKPLAEAEEDPGVERFRGLDLD